MADQRQIDANWMDPLERRRTVAHPLQFAELATLLRCVVGRILEVPMPRAQV